jgi:hypothetical protein
MRISGEEEQSRDSGKKTNIFREGVEDRQGYLVAESVEKLAVDDCELKSLCRVLEPFGHLEDYPRDTAIVEKLVPKPQGPDNRLDDPALQVYRVIEAHQAVEHVHDILLEKVPE